MSTTIKEALDTELSPTQAVSQFIGRLDQLAKTFHEEILFVFFDSFQGLSEAFQAVLDHYLPTGQQKSSLGRDQLRDLRLTIIEELGQVLQSFTEEQIPIIEQYLKVGCNVYLQNLNETIEAAPDRLMIEYPAESITELSPDSFRAKRKKWSFRLKSSLFNSSSSIDIHFKRLLRYEQQTLYLRNFHSFLNSLTLTGNEIVQKLEQLTFQSLDHRTTSSVSLAEDLNSFPDFLATIREQMEGFLPEFHQLLGIRLETEMKQLDVNHLSRKSKDIRHLLEPEIRLASSDWAANQHLIHESAEVSFRLQNINSHLQWLTTRIQAEIDLGYFTLAESNLARIKDNLAQIPGFIQDNRLSDFTSLDFDTSELLIFSDNQIIENGISHIREIISELPETVDSIPNSSWAVLKSGDQSRLSTEALPLAELVNYLTNTDYIAPIEKILKELPESFKKIHELIQGAIRLLSFNLAQDEGSISDSTVQEVMRQVHESVALAEKRLNEQRQALRGQLMESRKRVSQALFMKELLVKAEERKNITSRKSSRKDLTYFRNRWRSFIKSRLDWIMSLWRRTQDELLLAEFESDSYSSKNAFSSLRNFVDNSLPDSEVMSQLPFYYKQLFIGKQRVTKGMLAHCEQELQQAEAAYKRMKEGRGGGLLITGEGMSGKSFFSEYIAETLFSGRVYRISPSLAGSINKNDLHQTLAKQTKGKGSFYQLIKSCPEGSVFLFDDLELWWERSDQGLAVLMELFDLIERFSDTHFFIANCNLHFYKLVSQYAPIDIHFLTNICLSPFPSESLRQTIMDRHASGRFSFILDEVREQEISPKLRDQLFTRLLSISKGNIGFALRLWLRQIKHVKGDSIYLDMPQEQKMPAISEPDWSVLLAQFVLHKHLSLTKLMRIFENESLESIQEKLFPLQQIGILKPVSKHIYGIDPYILPFIVQQLKKAKMI
ncbi:MAG: hypothetical protein AAF587_12175 [Bacteroidota bacterium]